jgi:hypothetical protein
MTNNTGFELSVKHTVANLELGFPSYKGLAEFINAPVIRSDKMERLMENVLAFDGLVQTKLSLPNSRTNQYVANIQRVHEILIAYGFRATSQIFENTQVLHSSARSENFKAGLVSDMTGGTYVALNDRHLPIALVSIEHKVVTKGTHYIAYTVHFNGESDLVNTVREKILAECMDHVPMNATVKVANVQPNGELTYTDAKDFYKDPQLAHPAFYPWMVMPGSEDPLSAYFQEFLKSSARVLILIGPPGTGKSTMIRTMIAKHRVQATIAYTASTVQHPGFLGNFLREQEDNDDVEDSARAPALLVMEDSDEVIRSRELGNRLMAEFLNAADGIASNSHVKMVFSTNLKTARDIDEALMRPGRCFDLLPFRLLDVTQALAAREAIGLESREFVEGKLVTLSEALNEVKLNADQGVISPRFGFVPA